jgi:hypothetical protein
MTRERALKKEGEVVLLTSGEYSDYSVNAVVKVKKTFDLNAAALRYAKSTKGCHNQESTMFWVDSGSGFASFLEKEGLVEELETDEVNTSDLFFDERGK